MNTPNRGPTLISTADAAKVLGVTSQSVRRLVYSGQLTAFKVGAGDNAPFALEKEQVDKLQASRAAQNEGADGRH